MAAAADNGAANTTAGDGTTADDGGENTTKAGTAGATPNSFETLGKNHFSTFERIISPPSFRPSVSAMIFFLDFRSDCMYSMPCRSSRHRQRIAP